MKYRTTAAYISGGICGHMWMPQAMAGKLYKANLRGTFGLMPGLNDASSFEDVCSHVLMSEGGDFQDAAFTADTVIRIERCTPSQDGTYSVHVREIELAKICPDYVNAESFVSDFLGEE